MGEAKQQEIGTAVETQGAKTGVAFGIGNTTRTAAEEQAAVQAAINARAGGVDKAAALHDFNEMMKEEPAVPAAAAAYAAHSIACFAPNVPVTCEPCASVMSG